MLSDITFDSILLSIIKISEKKKMSYRKEQSQRNKSKEDEKHKSKNNKIGYELTNRTLITMNGK